MGGMGGFSSLNETQKKKLPAWIRAGLEKMEMDKLKKEQEEERKRRTEEKKRLRRLEEAEEVSKTSLCWHLNKDFYLTPYSLFLVGDDMYLHVIIRK